MSDTTLRAALRLLLEPCTAGDSVQILWHAGEPLAAGLEFFERASEIIREHHASGISISQIIQTNGTLITEEWCRFFVREKIRVGVSVDGPAEVHDRHRRDRADKPTHARVMRGLEHLRKHGIPLHAIAVLTSQSLNDADSIFDFFEKTGFESVGFNLEETEGVHTSGLAGDRRQTREKYAAFMTRLFSRWQAAGRRPRIREFESMSLVIGAFLRDHGFIRRLDDLIPFRNIVVTREGDISTFSPELAGGTPADPLHFAIGNVHRIRSFEELLDSPKLREIEVQISRGIARCRTECEYFPVCGGGTASNKFYENGTFDCTETTTCTLERKTLAHIVADGLRKLSTCRETSLDASGGFPHTSTDGCPAIAIPRQWDGEHALVRHAGPVHTGGD